MVEKRGTKCCAFGCTKRKKTGVRSDSEGSDDEESAKKRQFSRTLHTWALNLSYPFNSLSGHPIFNAFQSAPQPTTAFLPIKAWFPLGRLGRLGRWKIPKRLKRHSGNIPANNPKDPKDSNDSCCRDRKKQALWKIRVLL